MKLSGKLLFAATALAVSATTLVGCGSANETCEVEKVITAAEGAPPGAMVLLNVTQQYYEAVWVSLTGHTGGTSSFVYQDPDDMSDIADDIPEACYRALVDHVQIGADGKRLQAILVNNVSDPAVRHFLEGFVVE